MKTIILDRDGVINYDSDQYIKSPEEWIAIPGSLQAIAQLNQAGYQVMIATNQSGIARKLYDENILNLIHQKLIAELKKVGGTITDIFFCPHHPDDHCACRKPNPGMLQAIQKKYHVNLAETYFVGDTLKDIEAALAVGCKPILVLTGNGQRTVEKNPNLQAPVFADLASAVKFLLANST